MGQNLIEKIAQKYAVDLQEGQLVQSGDYISIQPAHVLTHDNTGAVMKKFKAIGATRVLDPSQPVFALDHDIQNTSDENLAKYGAIEAFARNQGIDDYRTLKPRAQVQAAFLVILQERLDRPLRQLILQSFGHGAAPFI